MAVQDDLVDLLDHVDFRVDGGQKRIIFSIDRVVAWSLRGQGFAALL